MFGSSASSASPLVRTANVSPCRGKPANGLRATMLGLPSGGTATNDAPVSQLSSSIIARASSNGTSRTLVSCVAVLLSVKSSPSFALTVTVLTLTRALVASATNVTVLISSGARSPSAQ